jgi:hypothetical protein
VVSTAGASPNSANAPEKAVSVTCGGETAVFQHSTDPEIKIGETAFRLLASRMSEKDVAELAQTCRSFFIYSRDLQVWEAQLAKKTRVADAAAHQRQLALDRVGSAESAMNVALHSVELEDLEVLRAYEQPPEMVRHVMSAAASIVANREVEWNNFSEVCTSLDDLKRVDIDFLAAHKPRVHEHAFDEAAVKKVSKAAAALWRWVGSVKELVKALEWHEVRKEEHRAATRDCDKIRLYVSQLR